MHSAITTQHVHAVDPSMLCDMSLCGKRVYSYTCGDGGKSYSYSL